MKEFALEVGDRVSFKRSDWRREVLKADNEKHVYEMKHLGNGKTEFYLDNPMHLISEVHRETWAKVYPGGEG